MRKFTLVKKIDCPHFYAFCLFKNYLYLAYFDDKNDGTIIHVYNLKNLNHLLEIKTNHDQVIYNCVITKNGNNIITASLDGTINLIDMSTNVIIIKKTDCLYHIENVSFINDKNYIYAALTEYSNFNFSKRDILYTANGEKCKTEYIEKYNLQNFPEYIFTLRKVLFDEKSNRLYGTTGDDVKCWDMTTDIMIANFKTGIEAIGKICIVNNYPINLLATSSKLPIKNGIIKIWDTTSWNCMTIINLDKNLVNFIVAPDGIHFFTIGHFDNFITVWDIYSRKQIQVIETGGCFNNMIIFNDGLLQNLIISGEYYYNYMTSISISTPYPTLINGFKNFKLYSDGTIRNFTGDHLKGDHSKGDHSKRDHLKGDHLNGDHLKGDHPKGDHPKGDHPKGDHYIYTTIKYDTTNEMIYNLFENNLDWLESIFAIRNHLGNINLSGDYSTKRILLNYRFDLFQFCIQQHLSVNLLEIINKKLHI